MKPQKKWPCDICNRLASTMRAVPPDKWLCLPCYRRREARIASSESRQVLDSIDQQEGER